MTKTYTLTESTRAKKPRSKKLRGLVAEATGTQTVQTSGSNVDTGFTKIEEKEESEEQKGKVVTGLEESGRIIIVKREATIIDEINVENPQEGQIMQYKNGKWVNVTPGEDGYLQTADGHALTWTDGILTSIE